MPGWLRVRSEKVATPLTTVAVRVPPRVAPPGLFPRATVTVPPLTGFPRLSSTWTVRPKGLPATTLDGGSVWIAIWLASP